MKQLLILSGKGGTGKTTIASSFIKLSKSNAYADCDVDAPNLHLIMNQPSEPLCSDYFGLPKALIDSTLCQSCGLCMKHCKFEAVQCIGTYTIDSFSCEGCGVCEKVCPSSAITLVPEAAGELMFYVNHNVFSTAKLKMGSGTSGKLVTEVKKQLPSASSDAKSDLVIIDGSPGIGCPVIASLSGVDMVLIVAEPSISGISDMERIIDTANKFQTPVAVCINKYDTNLTNTEKIKKYCESNKIPFAGVIPYDRTAVKAINKGKSVIDMDCIAADSIKEVFKNTCNKMEVYNENSSCE